MSPAVGSWVQLGVSYSMAILLFIDVSRTCTGLRMNDRMDSLARLVTHDSGKFALTYSVAGCTTPRIASAER